MKIKAVLFGFIGTTVKEKNSDQISRFLARSFMDHGFFLKHEFFASATYKDKPGIIKEVLERYNLPISQAPAIYESFKRNIEQNLASFTPNDDSLFVFSYLLRRGISLGIGTGLPREVFDIIFSHLGWNKHAFSYLEFCDGTEKSRPDLILDMMLKFNVKDPKEILKVGGTVVDILQGKNAGYLTAAVLSGTQPAEDLMKQEPDYLLESLSDLKTVIKENMKFSIPDNSCGLV